MSSDSSGRYQSRLFKFLNRQSVRLSDRVDRTIRNIKVAAVWGVQILLYPMYLLVQGGLSVGRQLTAEAEAGWPKLKEFTHKDHEDQPPQEMPPESDTPIQRVLSEVNTLSLPEVSDLAVLQPGVLVEFGSQGVIDQQETTDNGQLTTASTTELQHQSANQDGLAGKQTRNNRYAIQGVASLLATRSLVLVTVENQILDILTPQQQQKLASKMSWEVANLLRQRRLVQSSQLKTTTPRLSTLDQPRVFLPLRIFWKVMAWVQASPVAIAANVFQESSLVSHDVPFAASHSQPQLPASNDGAIANPLAPQTAIAFLDHAIADLESHQLVPGTEALIRLRDSLQDRWNSSPLANVSNPDAKWTLAASRSVNKIQALIQNLIPSPQDSDATPETSQKHSFQIQALIYAAIEYFFGRGGTNLSGTDSQGRLPLRGSAKRSQIPGGSQGNAHQLYGHHSPSLSPAQPDAGEPDPWLSWDDLFGNPDISDSISHSTPVSQELDAQSPNSQFHTQLPEAFNSKMPIKPGNSVWQVFKRAVSPQKSPGKRSAPSTKKPTVQPPSSIAQTGKLTTRKKTPPLTTPATDKGRNITKQPQKPSSGDVASRRPRSVVPAKTENTALTTPSTPAQNSHLEPSPDWIETKATPTGYVKHPLERVLGWLDFAMLWLEELALKIWRGLRRLRG